MSFGGVGYGACGSGLIQPDTPGRLGHRFTGNTTRQQGACWTTGQRVLNRIGKRGPRRVGLGLTKIAVVKRRKARRPASWAGSPFRRRDWPNRKAGHGCGVPHQRFAALHLPRSFSRRAGTEDGWAPQIPATMKLAALVFEK